MTLAILGVSIFPFRKELDESPVVSKGRVWKWWKRWVEWSGVGGRRESIQFNIMKNPTGLLQSMAGQVLQ